MFKVFAICVIAFISIALSAMAFPIKTDTTTKVAKRDAKNFRLSDSLWKANRLRNFPETSDYFKPTNADVKNVALLNDSVYVQAFRKYARKQNAHRRTTGHYFVVGGVVTVGVAVLALAAILIFIAPKME